MGREEEEEEEADGLWEDKDATGVAAAVVLPLGLTDDEADFSDSGDIKRSELIRSRTDWELNSQGREEDGRLGPVGARVLHHCLSSPIRLRQLEYESRPSFPPRTTAEAPLYN